MRSRVAGVGVAVLCIATALWVWRRWQPGVSDPTAKRATIAAASASHSSAPVRLSPGNVQASSDPQAAFSLEGRVLSAANGAGIADALVGFGGAGAISEVKTDGAGHFVWTTPTPGPYQLASISATGYVAFSPELGHSPVMFSARAGVKLSGVTLFLSPLGKRRAGDGGAADEDEEDEVPARRDAGARQSGRVTGLVHDKEGKPIVAFTIIAATRHGGVERGERSTGSFFDAEGRFALDGVEAGAQCVTAYALGYAGSAERCVDVAPGGEGRLDFELTRGARISGRVTDRASRSPLAGARVSLENPNGGGDTPMPVIASTETDADGRFQLSGTDTGLRSIFVTAEGHHSRVVPGLQLEADRDAPSVEIDLLALEPGEEARIESAGINAVVSAVGDTLVLGKCTPEGGAAQAGLKEGDVLLAVDGVSLAQLGMQAGVERLRGPEGSTVTVTIRRGEDPPRDVVVTRRRVVNR